VGKQVTQREIDLAIETVVRGYGFQRSFTHPYLFEKVDGLWRTHDEPRKKGGERREEFISHRMDPTDVHAVARKHARGHYCLCPIHGPDDDADLIRDTYKDLGYRLNHTEFFMIHSLSRIPRVVSPVTLERVTTMEMAERLAKTAARRQILPEHVDAEDPPMRVYVALVKDDIVGWVNSVVADKATYCGGMYVQPEHRRQGIARALLAKMLRDDRKGGARQASLLASHAGAKLYPVVGYSEVGTMMVLTPKKK
jgi:GNAT superfamily N-acetyltransferase|tara:strand:- start:180 stop:938 length:759 start_codon:yes stop_codon:yes gene_type:complete